MAENRELTDDELENVNGGTEPLIFTGKTANAHSSAEKGKAPKIIGQTYKDVNGSGHTTIPREDGGSNGIILPGGGGLTML